MKAYLKTLILFPLLLQILATALLYFLDFDLDGIVPFSRYLMTAFFFATLPAFFIACVAAKFRYVRHNIAAIVLSSSLIMLFYGNFVSYCYLLIFSDEEISFWQWLVEGGLALGLISLCSVVFYSLFVLPWLLPKAKP